MVDLPVGTLFRILSEDAENPTIGSYSSKTVRARLEFSPDFSTRLARAINPTHSTPFLPEIARQCYLFLNAEPVFTSGPPQSVFVAVSQSPRESDVDYVSCSTL